MNAEVTKLLKDAGASDSEVEEFLQFCSIMTSDNEGLCPMKVRWEIYRLWARLCRNKRTKLNQQGWFNFPELTKEHLRALTGPPVADHEPPEEAYHLSAEEFVKFVVRHLEEAF